jgi:predicted nucleotidyltransferase component of viral defense system
LAKGKRKPRASEVLEWEERIKKLVIVSLFADDELMERFVLKGGNALDLIHQASTRASLDIDLSMADDFEAGKLGDVRAKIERNLQQTFRPAGYEPFDITLTAQPKNLAPELTGFWGGYRMEFKLIDSTRFAELCQDWPLLQRNAMNLGQKGKIQVDISKFEYTAPKKRHELEGYTIYVYTPAMIIGEKLRAICQQMPEYAKPMNKAQKQRARDFLDIHSLIEHFSLDMTSKENRALLRHIFDAKKVPLRLLGKVGEYCEFHRLDFPAVEATVKPGVKLKDFDFYAQSLVELCGRLKTLWDE